MSSKDIEKLREKVEKDPNSKLFVPLAEEYRKENRLDEAITVLLDGIGRQPGYVSARVSLGKMYLEKGLRNEARAEFENVVKSIPDNLYAHKKLAEIYRASGENELARRSYLTVLKLNAMDEEALASLQELDAGEAEMPPANESGGENPVAEEFPLHNDVGAVEPAEAEAALPQDDFEIQQTGHDEEFSMFKDSLFGARATGIDGEEIIARDEDSGMQPDEPGDKAVEQAFVQEEAKETDEDAAFFEEGLTELPEGEGDDLEAFQFGEDFEDAPSSFFESVSDDAGPGSDAPRDAADVTATLEAADRDIAEGNYATAMKTYRKILSSSPEDRKTLQRVEELRALLRMMGREQEFVVARLTGFLEGIRKRRDGLRRSS